MTDGTLNQFRNELTALFVIVVLNIVFGALAMAFGVQYMVSSVSGQAAGQSMVLRIVAGSVAMVCFGLGIAWIISSVTIFDGIEELREEFQDRKKPVSDETLTSGIIRMMAHYRQNTKTIHTMILVCTLGGFCFLALGIINSLEFLSISLSSGQFTLKNYLLIPAALLTLGIALVSLLSSYYFSKFSRTWDLRLMETARSEEMLKKSLGIDTE
ncbi:MAG: hypothetical protein LUQ61_02035 [Methanoregulaceae archaeon]|jgi:uncharacterized membrane protein HdeD (DUF308 family)|nr:hypothetical protein [Methanoregulaceae archaeon]